MSASSSPNAVAAYQVSNVALADPAQVIVLLYDGAIYRIGQALQEIEKQNTLASGIAIYRALAIIGELRNSLNLEVGGEIAMNLDRLYLYMHEELVKGHLARRTEPLERVRKLLMDLNEAWKQVIQQAKQVPASENNVASSVAMGAGIRSYSQPESAPRLALRA